MLPMRKPLPKLDPSYANAVVSTGTAVESELLKAMAEALDEAHPGDNDAAYAMSILENYGNFGHKTDLFCKLREQGWENNETYAIIWEIHKLLYITLPDKLDEVAPVDYAFGFHPDIPLCLGFWPKYK